MEMSRSIFVDCTSKLKQKMIKLYTIFMRVQY